MATEERLSAEEHGLQFVQSVVQLRQRTIQTPLIHLRASLPWNKDLRQASVDVLFLWGNIHWSTHTV